MFSFKYHVKYLFCLKLLVYWRELLLKICLKINDVKENSVQWTHRDSNRECLKFDKVGKHSSSTKIITANNINASYQQNALPAINIKIHHTSLQNRLGKTRFITG